MAFRLMSAVAGAAKRGSERLKALEDDTKKLITTEASRVAEDARNISKARTKSVLEYNQAATDVEYLSASVDFAYQLYEIESIT